jgi:aspartate racemase
MKKILGILSEIETLASAEFFKTTYEFNLTNLEQELSIYILSSATTIFNRINAIIDYSTKKMLNSFVEQNQADNLIAGCPEAHILSRHLSESRKIT